MAKLPRYVEANWDTDKFSNGLGKLKLKVSIKKWGIPVLIFKALKSSHLKPYKWLLFPYLWAKIMLKKG